MKKTLIVTYYWPPAGGPGVQRWLKFVKYLPDFNIEPIVFAPENPSYPILDESLNSEVSKAIEILKLPIKEPYRAANLVSKGQAETISKGIIPVEKNQSMLQKLMIYIRGNFFIPDARKNWVKPSVKYLSAYLTQHNIDTVITTGPPHSLHLIGLKLKEQLNIQWIADFRDPWTNIGYHKKLRLNAASRARHKNLEKKVLQLADKIIVTSGVTENEFKSKTNQPISVITNGYDHEIKGATQLDSRFSISHIGTLLSERNPENLWKALYELSRENNTFKSMLQINLIGSVSQEVLLSLESYDLSQYLNLKGYVSHAEAIENQRTSQLLLLVEIDSEETRCIIPGKLFEYMVSERPILAIGPENSDVEQIISETNTGHYFLHSDHKALKKTILEQFEAFRQQDLKSHPIGLQQYHRKALTKTLAELILN
ncbi:MAG: glycosyltransferase family 4 protein [Flavobacteriaceae bacterium]|nr:glycosyltransferase family 4 protein [Flavobacteriaceae bacterium]